LAYDNNSTRIRRELLVKLARLYLNGALLENIDRLPLEMRPKRYRLQHLRCCIHTERAIIKYRLMTLLGFLCEDETDEMKPLSAYAREAMARKTQDPRLLSVIDDACSACVQSKYFVTNACRGCMAQPCILNCPKKAITMDQGHSKIDPEACVNCGKCKDMCPFHAILYVPVPCEEACPVGAVTRGESGKEIIDHERCIHCGRCVQACPFGAIVEPSQVMEVLGALTGTDKTVALFAPSLAAQFDGSVEKVVGALKALGFDEVVEVASGADLTTAHEAEELVERLEAGEAFMTTSCCPAYTGFVDRHLPELRSQVSDTPTPLAYAAQLSAERTPDAKRIFISPCIAKRREVMENPQVDYTLTFEELGGLLVAKGIDVATCESEPAAFPASGDGRGYGANGGVRDAVAHKVGDRVEIRSELISGLGPEAIKRLKQYVAGKGEGNFVECMSCENGCISGPAVLANPRLSRRKLEAIVKASD
jgi:[FeFe] hydrogenase (group B1/B3)